MRNFIFGVAVGAVVTTVVAVLVIKELPGPECPVCGLGDGHTSPIHD
jgi:hypothetical protein